ncbi:MAG: DUF4412 domain-containing protein [Balneola sp.]
MKSRFLLIPVFALCFLMIGSTAQAQFEGQITMNLYGEEDGVEEVSKLNMYVTTDRIFVKGEDDMNFGESFNSGGMLIRNDKKDFVVLMENNDALQVTKSEVEGLLKMFMSWGGDSSKGSSNKERSDFDYTGKVKDIKGYESHELLITDTKNNSSISVWLTPNIDINWGMLAEPWKNLSGDADRVVNQISRDAIFSSDNFPMLIEVHGEKGTQKVMEVQSINKSNIAKAMVQIPTGVNLIGVSEFMFKMMSGN